MRKFLTNGRHYDKMVLEIKKRSPRPQEAAMKIMKHSEYMKDLKSRSLDSLIYTRNDAREALNAMPLGPNAGYYTDEIHYCAMEMANRVKRSIKRRA